VKVGSAQVSLAAAGFVLKVGGGQGFGVFLGEVVGWVDFCRMWLRGDIWSIMFQTDKMKK